MLLKPSIKTTCSEWYGGTGPYFVFLCICSEHLSRHCFCQAIAVAVNRSAAERYVAGVSPFRLTFSQLFPSDFRRPLALRYRQAKGWGGYIFYWSSLGKVWLVFELAQFCVKQSNQTLAGSERIANQHRQCLILSRLWWTLVSSLAWIKTKPKPPKLTKILSALVMAASMINTYCSLFH